MQRLIERLLFEQQLTLVASSAYKPTIANVSGIATLMIIDDMINTIVMEHGNIQDVKEPVISS